MDISDITEAIASTRAELAAQAQQEILAQRFDLDEIYYTVLQGEIVENYPNEKPQPRVLVVGQTFRGDPIHTLWSYDAANKIARLESVYRPDPEKWLKGRIRRTAR